MEKTSSSNPNCSSDEDDSDESTVDGSVVIDPCKSLLALDGACEFCHYCMYYILVAGTIKLMESTVSDLPKTDRIRKFIDEARSYVVNCQEGILAVIEGEDEGDAQHLIAGYIELALDNCKFV